MLGVGYLTAGLARSAVVLFGYGRELPENDDRGGAKVSALLLSAVMRPGTPWVRSVEEKSARLAASSLIVPLR